MSTLADAQTGEDTGGQGSSCTVGQASPRLGEGQGGGGRVMPGAQPGKPTAVPYTVAHDCQRMSSCLVFSG